MSHALLLQVGAGLGIIGLSTIPGVLAFLSQLRLKTPKDNFYEDKDGKSTPEAVAAFSNRWPKVILTLLAITGLASSVAISILTTVQDIDKRALFLENWLVTASWVGFLPLKINIARLCLHALRFSLEYRQSASQQLMTLLRLIV